mmetsp:Transcript_25648/g.37618  ORF Transcript_25648/g.37618 Transcript_25648/m.37618 type:complete len:136 (-) Transcript_25648:46-453(-)
MSLGNDTCNGETNQSNSIFQRAHKVWSSTVNCGNDMKIDDFVSCAIDENGSERRKNSSSSFGISSNDSFHSVLSHDTDEDLEDDMNQIQRMLSWVTIGTSYTDTIHKKAQSPLPLQRTQGTTSCQNSHHQSWMNK